MPGKLWFKPRGVPLSEIEEIILNADELEAMRLRHREDLNQEEAAHKMRVSRTTFSRILKAAHEKVTTFLTTGTALRIEEPDYVYIPREFNCQECGHEWNAAHGEGRPSNCPNCESNKIKQKIVKRPKKQVGGDLKCHGEIEQAQEEEEN